MFSPTTTYDQNGLLVKVSWIQPYTNPTMSITAYNIIIKDSSGDYISHPSCDGTDTTITNLTVS